MKTREIDVWAHMSACDNLSSVHTQEIELHPSMAGKIVKAKLLIPVEEKKVEVTRSQFAVLWDKHISGACFSTVDPERSIVFNDVCKALGLEETND